MIGVRIFGNLPDIDATFQNRIEPKRMLQPGMITEMQVLGQEEDVSP